MENKVELKRVLKGQYYEIKTSKINSSILELISQYEFTANKKEAEEKMKAFLNEEENIENLLYYNEKVDLRWMTYIDKRKGYKEFYPLLYLVTQKIKELLNDKTDEEIVLLAIKATGSSCETLYVNFEHRIEKMGINRLIDLSLKISCLQGRRIPKGPKLFIECEMVKRIKNVNPENPPEWFWDLVRNETLAGLLSQNKAYHYFLSKASEILKLVEEKEEKKKFPEKNLFFF